jgi:hypothetical protein
MWAAPLDAALDSLRGVVSIHPHLVSPICARKKSLICGIYIGLPRYYNRINRQAGRTLTLPPPKSSPAFLLPARTVLGRLHHGAGYRRTAAIALRSAIELTNLFRNPRWPALGSKRPALCLLRAIRYFGRARTYQLAPCRALVGNSACASPG